MSPSLAERMLRRWRGPMATPLSLRLAMLGHAAVGRMVRTGLLRERKGPPPVLVVGMHRSGTSCLTGLLAEAGLFLGPTLAGNRHNARGYFENELVVHLHHRAVFFGGGVWLHPKIVADGPWERDVVAGLRFHLARLARGRPWGVKDPHMMWCLPLWQAAGSCRLVAVFRHPAAVCASVLAREEGLRGPFGRPLALHGWKRYARRLLDLHRDEGPFPVLCFDDPPDRFLRAVATVAEGLGLRPRALGGYAARLRHHDEAALPVDDESLDLHRRLRALAVG